MESTTTTIEGRNLPTDVIALEQAEAAVSDERLEETIATAMENGYFLAGVDEHDFFGTQYTLEKVEVGE